MKPTFAPRLTLGLAALVLCSAGLVSAAPPTAASQAMITPNYKDADLGQIVEAVSQVTGKNFIIDPRVKAQVTMLSSTPMSPAAFYEAFLAILQVHGFVAVPAGAVYKIVPDVNARQMPGNDVPERVTGGDELVTQVVALRSVSASVLVPILRPLIPQYGNLAAYAPSNVLIISDRAANVNRLLRIIERIDQQSDEDIEVIRLEHASSAEIVRVVNSLNQAAGGAEAGAQVKLVADERTNSVLISGERSQRLRLRALVAHLDTPLERGGGTVVRYLKYADAEKLAKSLKEQIQAANAAAGAGTAGAAAQGVQAQQDKSTTIWAEPTTNALIITAGPKMMRQINDVVDRLDIRRPQVLVEAIIVEISGNKEADLGINWLLNGNGTNVGAGGFVSPVGGTSIADIAGAALNTAAITSASVPTGTTFALGRLAKTGVDFAAVLRAVNGISNTNIVSTPSVTTLDNQEATIKVVSEVPFLTGQYANTTASQTGATGSVGVVNPFQTITRQDVGTILKITPQITDDATILLKIDQEVSSLAQGTQGAVDLITNKRQVSTRVLAGDGEVIVLGGLIEDNLLEGEQNVPFLSKIPLLGQLFKVRNTTKTKTNLLIFIRAKILVDAAQIATETEAKYNYARDIQKSRGKGDAQLLPGEHQPTLPDLRDLAPPPGSQAVLPKSGGRSTPLPAAPAAPVAPAKADETTGLLPGASVPPATTPLPRSQVPPPSDGAAPPPAPAPDATPPKGAP